MLAIVLVAMQDDWKGSHMHSSLFSRDRASYLWASLEIVHHATVFVLGLHITSTVLPSVLVDERYMHSDTKHRHNVGFVHQLVRVFQFRPLGPTAINIYCSLSFSKQACDSAVTVSPWAMSLSIAARKALYWL